MSKYRNYAVVNFIRENQVAAVPSKWVINGNQAYYPSFVTTRTKEEYLRNLPEPKKSWKLYEVHILKTCGNFNNTLK